MWKFAPRTIVPGLLGAVLLLACDESSDPAGPGDDAVAAVAGTYALTSINGQALPATLVDESGPGCDQRIHSASLTLRTDRTFTAAASGEDVRRTDETASCDEVFNDAEDGTFELDAETIIFTAFFGAEPPITGTLSGSVITLTIPGEAGPLALRFEKSDDAGGTVDYGAVAGTYALTSINGQALPATLVDESGPGCDQRIDAGSLTLRTDRTFTAAASGEDVRRTDETAACDDVFDVADDGTFELDGERVSFTAFFEAEPPITGTLSGSVITLTIPGEAGPLALRFEK